MSGNENAITKYLLQFCYTCVNAGECLNEEHVMDCMRVNGMESADLTEESFETQRLLKLYAE